MDQAEIRRHVSRLLDWCQDCPRWQNKPEGFHPDELCGGCAIYAKLREAGKQLGGHAQTQLRFPLTIKEYMHLRKEGKTDKEIAHEISRNTSAIEGWKRRNGIKTGQQRRVKENAAGYRNY